MSGSVVRNMSGLGVRNGNTFKGTLVTGDPEDEIRRSVHRLAGRAARSERAFSTHQGRLPQELAKAGVTDMASVNRYLEQVYMARYIAEFSVKPGRVGRDFCPRCRNMRGHDESAPTLLGYKTGHFYLHLTT